MHLSVYLFGPSHQPLLSLHKTEIEMFGYWILKFDVLIVCEMGSG